MNWIKIANYCWTLLISFGFGCKRSFHFRWIISFGLGCIKWFYSDLVHNIQIHKNVANGVAVLIYIEHSLNWYYFLVNHQTKTLTLATSLKFCRTYTYTYSTVILLPTNENEHGNPMRNKHFSTTKNKMNNENG